MTSIIRIKENDEIREMLALLQNTIYKGLGKTEILRVLLAGKSWEVRQQISILDNTTKASDQNIKESAEGVKITDLFGILPAPKHKGFEPPTKKQMREAYKNAVIEKHKKKGI